MRNLWGGVEIVVASGLQVFCEGDVKDMGRVYAINGDGEVAQESGSGHVHEKSEPNA